MTNESRNKLNKKKNPEQTADPYFISKSNDAVLKHHMSSLSQMSPVVPCCPPAASSSQTNNPRCRCRPYAVPLTVYLFNPLHSLFPPPVQLSLLGGTEKKDTQSRRVGAALSLKGRQRKRFVQRSTLTFLGLCLTKLKQTRRIGKQTCGATCKPRLR